MVNVAIAGGTGVSAGTIVEVMKESSRHRPFILSRKASDQIEILGAQLIQVDYSNVESLKAILEEHCIHTVISTFAIEGDSLSTSQMNLIRAAAASSETKRFAPSAFAIPYPRDFVDTLPPLKYYFDSIDELKKTDLQWTTFLNGMFIDYYAMPHIKTYLKPNVLVLDIANKAAGIPGSGEELVTFTYTFDVAKFVVASLDLAEWPEESRIVGDQVTWNEFLRLAEEARGTKFTVQHDGLEKLKNFQITELPSHPVFYAKFSKERFQWFLSIFELWTATGISNIPIKDSLNTKFPNIKPLTVREMLNQFWKER